MPYNGVGADKDNICFIPSSLHDYTFRHFSAFERQDYIGFTDITLELRGLQVDARWQSKEEFEYRTCMDFDRRPNFGPRVTSINYDTSTSEHTSEQLRSIHQLRSMLQKVAGEIHPEDVRVHVEIPHYVFDSHYDDDNPNDLLAWRSHPEKHTYPKWVPVSTRWIQKNGVWLRLYGEVDLFNSRDSHFLRHFFHEMNRVERDASNNTAEHVANVLYGRILAATPGLSLIHI